MSSEYDPVPDLRPTVHLRAPDDVSNSVDPSPEVIGDYELLMEIGRGGMGVVYQARQRSLNRLVALKLIRSGTRARPEDIARFRTEAAAAARLRHPGIVAIHEVGEHAGRQYYSMDFLPGDSLAESLRDGPLEPRRAAGCVRAVAEAMDHAHVAGVLHRDLKPSNILLDSEGRPQIADFGLAKLLQADSELTLSGAVLGSPSYMPPEQATGRHGQVSVRSDLYALGAILYECLTGRPPFAAATPLETMKLVVEQEPVSPRQINPTLPRDLETIALKCLEKNPAARYGTARELADELGRYLADEPIRARRTGSIERAGRWCRRKPALAALVAVSLAAAVAIAIVLAGSNARIRREQRTTRENLYAADVSLAGQAVNDGWLSAARQLLQAHQPPPGSSDERGFEWRWLWQQTRDRSLQKLPPQTADIGAIAYSPDGRRLVTARVTGLIQVWDTASWWLLQSWTGPSRGVAEVSFSADARLVAISGSSGGVELREVDTGRDVLDVQSPIGQGLPRFTALCSPRNPRLALPWIDRDGSRSVRVFGWPPGEIHPVRELFRITNGAGISTFMPDGRLLLTVAGQFGAYDLDARTFHPLPAPPGVITSVSPDGRTLAGHVQENRQTPFVRGLSDAEPGWLGRDRGEVVGGWEHFSPDGRHLVSSDGLTLRFWNIQTRTEERRLGLPGYITGFALAPDGRRVATADGDGHVRIWPTETPPQTPALTGMHWPHVLSPDGQWLAATRWRLPAGTNVAALDGLAVGHLASGEIIHVTTDPSSQPLGFTRDSRSVTLVRRVTNGLFQLEEHPLPGGPTRMVRTFRVNHDEAPPPAPLYFDADGQRVFPLPPVLVGPGAVEALPTPGPARISRPPEATRNPPCFWRASTDGRRFAFCGTNGAITLWNRDGEAPLAQLPGGDITHPAWTFTPDGRLLALHHLGGGTNTLEVWDVEAGRRLWAQPCAGVVKCITFSATGHQMILFRQDLGIQMWDVPSGSLLRTFLSPFHNGDQLALSPDGRTLALGGAYGVIVLFHVPTGRELFNISRSSDLTHASPYHGVKPTVARWPRTLAFSEDGRTLVSADWGGFVRVWRAPDPVDSDGAVVPPARR